MNPLPKPSHITYSLPDRFTAREFRAARAARRYFHTHWKMGVALGLGTVLRADTRRDADRYRELLTLDEDHMPVYTMPIGSSSEEP